MLKKPRLIWIGATVAALALAVGGVWWVRADEARAVAVAALPARPELGRWPQELRDRIARAEDEARSRFGATKGLGELSRLYHANGFLAEAVRCYEGLAWMDSRAPRWLHLRATILAGFGELEEALLLERRTLALQPDYVPAALRVADLLLKKNQPVEAAAAYEAVLKLKADEPYAQLGLARIDFEAGRWEQARQRLEPLVAQTNFVLGYDLIVTVYERLGLEQRAAVVRSQGRASGAFRDAPDAWIDELYDVCFDPYRLGVAGGAAARAGDMDTGFRLVERAVEIAPADVGARFQLAGLCMQRKEFSSAKMHFERCTQIAPEFADGWAHLSALFAQLGDAAGAERVLAEGLRKCPESPGLLLMRARGLKAAGRISEAIATYRESIRRRSNEADPHVELAKLLFTLDRVDEGLASLRKALEAEPENPAALGILAFYAISTGDEAAARGWLARVRNQPRVPRDQAERLLAEYRNKFGRSP